MSLRIVVRRRRLSPLVVIVERRPTERQIRIARRIRLLRRGK